MNGQSGLVAGSAWGTIRLDILIRWRWLNVAAQALGVLLIYWWFDFTLPVGACLTVIAVAAWLNFALRVRFPLKQRLEPERAAWVLAFDTAELAMLLFFTGGLENPFALVFVGPVLISATALPPRVTLMLGGFAVACATLLVFWHDPLPSRGELPLRLPREYVAAIWVSILVAITFIGVHAWQITDEARRLVQALAATELVLAREQHLSQLDGLAAAAAHELGTPLSTISVIAKELQLATKPDSKHCEDVRLLNEQAQRCRAILGRLGNLTAQDAFDRLRISALLEEIAAGHRGFGVTIDITLARSPTGEPMTRRNPAILYGLGNLVENAVDFAHGRVEIAAKWSTQDVAISIADDGPGFAPEVLDRMGDPYIATPHRKRHAERGAATDNQGLGLGFFIAKTLLERSGATLDHSNRDYPHRGAIVRVVWSRAHFEQVEEYPASSAPQSS
jgi:two-component system sensor histidine kinase RegB